MSENNLEKFKDTWNEEIRKIENEIIDSSAYRSIYNQFRMGRIRLGTNMRSIERTGDVCLELELLESRLKRALGIARTNFELQNRSLKVRFIESVADIVRSIADFVSGVPKLKG